MTQNEIIEAEMERILLHIRKNYFKIRNEDLTHYILIHNIDIFLMRTVMAYKNWEETGERDDLHEVELINDMIYQLSKINDYGDSDPIEMAKLGMYLANTYQEIGLAVLT